MSTSTSTQSTPSQTSILFARGVLARLAYWPALRIAVDHAWGGPESAAKRTWLASVLVDDFEGALPSSPSSPSLAAADAPDADYVEDRLLQVMADEFDAVLEDGSAEAVARDVVRLWAEVSMGRDGLVKEFEERAERLGGRKVQAEEAAGDNSDWEDVSDEEGEGDGGDGEGDGDGEEAPQLLESRQQRPPKDMDKEEPEVDADGFITVKSKGKSHR